MRTLIIFALIGVSVQTARGFAVPPWCRPQKILKHAELELPSKTNLTVDVADTVQTREIGLMCRPNLPRKYGMLFVFPKEDELGFWMKNTLTPLDMVWIDSKNIVTTVAEHVQESTLDTPDALVKRASGRGQYVLELPAGMAKKFGLVDSEGKVAKKDGAAVRILFTVDIPKN